MKPKEGDRKVSEKVLTLTLTEQQGVQIHRLLHIMRHNYKGTSNTIKILTLFRALP